MAVNFCFSTFYEVTEYSGLEETREDHQSLAADPAQDSPINLTPFDQECCDAS